jgi:hypothetical protein
MFGFWFEKSAAHEVHRVVRWRMPEGRRGSSGDDRAKDDAMRRDVLFLFVYACVVCLVLGVVLVITRDGQPLDESAIQKKWDRALHHLGM